MGDEGYRRLFTKVDLDVPVYDIDLENASDSELEQLSQESGIGLSLEEMQRVRDHFKEKERNPTDIELEALGQAWSEHCCYKSSKVILKEHVFGIEASQNILVISEDAGVVEFDDEHAYVVALESHNHPSAIEPYGGAATGIGGIVRDVVCMGAQPVAFIDPLFFGPLDYPYEKLAKGVKHPKYLFSGVVAGIRDYGNRIGIPTTTGMVYFHEGYVGNCIVNVGCVGIAKKDHIIRSRVKEPGNVYVLLGGRTGRDGIHGVTFASAELTAASEMESRGAVQLGDPITKEPTIHVCLEANEKGLLDGMKDLGGGGLSCVVGEMALAAGFGAEVQLEKVPLKEEDMSPWEIWVSESQERMMFAVNPKNLEEVLYICKKWDVEANDRGKVIPEKTLRVFWGDKKIFEMDLEFLTGGPVYCRPYEIKKAKEKIEESIPQEPDDVEDVLLRLLSSQNIANKEWVIRVYDHTVRGNTILKPLQGKIGRQSHGDAAVMKPLEHSFRGMALSSDVNPSFLEIDPYWGACSIIDENCRNLVAVGARPHSFADCLNFGNPEKPTQLGDFYEAVRGLGDTAKALGIPYVSGNVSFYNEAGTSAVPPTPTILGVGIVNDIRSCVTVDFKKEGNPIYLIGETKPELGGSAYFKLLGGKSAVVPKVDFDLLKKSIDSMLRVDEKGFVASCHDLSDGGLAVSLAEMCIGGDFGADIDITTIGDIRGDFKLFSESNTRWIVEVKKEDQSEFEVAMDVPIFNIGKVGGSRLIVTDKINKLIDFDVSEIRRAWNDTLWSIMG
ncbi:MAG: phosphoribosylformylglycinamidine synthase subunit PurL [Thermoplasmata archaeon]|nr:MAG: phosphoribosylformylglycinamidine synthase subunit PurL [Thermoplasmata archaeon]